MPAVFFGHGSPMNALERNRYTDAWSAVGAAVPRPRAILCISAHWYVPGTAVTFVERPRTIHDFGNFPRALFAVQYPAPGDLDLCRRVADLIGSAEVRLDRSWGLDHGTWSVLVHAFPNADVPVVQLSIDMTKPPAAHFDLAARLAPLRDEGVLIAGSGNVVHNLELIRWSAGSGAEPYDWATRFNTAIREVLESGDRSALLGYQRHPDAALAAPDPDHFFPLLYVMAQQRAGEAVDIAVDGIELGSVGMLSAVVG
ncbi:MAG: 4,5-DOPA dioxygenase extradiol [Candidatus Velthaea sp.]